jgi:ribosome-associated toxin RatA of RatAB toxin-antitoxin module
MADQTESSIDVAAPPAAVMAVIADVAAYPQWSEGISKVEVLTTGDDGRPATARFHISAGPVKDVYELKYTWNGDESVQWSLVKGEMLTMMDGEYTLRSSGAGTAVHYRLAVDLRIPMIGMFKRKAEKTIVDNALKGLRKRVESQA